jgi:hypothetical protein
MRDEWIGDRLDLMKWSAVKKLVDRRRSVKPIITYIPYWRSTDICPETVNAGVWEHFRSRRRYPGPFVREENVFTNACWGEPYSSRKTYHTKATEFLELVRKRTDGPMLLFLDPDTGLSPQRANLNHVTEKEVKSLWDKLHGGDVLAVFQHRPRSAQGLDWRKNKAKQLAEFTGLSIASGNFEPTDTAIKNAVLLYVDKPKRGSRNVT